MPTNTSLTINSTDASGKKVTDKITYVNPNITNQQALDLAQAINNLTNNTYSSTTRTDTSEIDASKPSAIEAIHFFKTASTGEDVTGLTNWEWTWELSEVATKYSQPVIEFRIKMPNLGVCPTIKNMQASTDISIGAQNINYKTNDAGTTAYLNDRWNVLIYYSKAVGTIEFDLHIDETANYAAYDLHCKINIIPDEEG